MTWQDVLNAGLQAQTNAIIAERLTAMTVRDIPLQELREWLRENDLWYMAVGVPKGAMQTYFVLPLASGGPSATNLTRLESFWVTAFDYGSSVMPTRSKPAQADRIEKLTSAVSGAAPRPWTNALRNQFYALGGGKLFPSGVTEAEVQTAKSVYDAAVASDAAKAANAPKISAAWNQHVAPVAEDVSLVVGGGLSDLAAFKAALAAMAASL